MAKRHTKKSGKKVRKQLKGRGFSKSTKTKAKKVAKTVASTALTLAPLVPLALSAVQQRRQGVRHAQLEDYRRKIHQGLAQSRAYDRNREEMARIAQELAQKWSFGRR